MTAKSCLPNPGTLSHILQKILRHRKCSANIRPQFALSLRSCCRRKDHTGDRHNQPSSPDSILLPGPLCSPRPHQALPGGLNVQHVCSLRQNLAPEPVRHCEHMGKSPLPGPPRGTERQLKPAPPCGDVYAESATQPLPEPAQRSAKGHCTQPQEFQRQVAMEIAVTHALGCAEHFDVIQHVITFSHYPVFRPPWCHPP